MKKINAILAISILFSAPAFAEVDLNIYNNNLALVKDTRAVSLNVGTQKVFFDGVSANLNPQSAFLLNNDIDVVEKNYNYNLINQENMLDFFINKEIKTIVTDQQTGKDTIKKATVLANNYGTPVLKFDYGIETNFNGRLVFDSLPKSLNAKPSFEVVLNSIKKETKNLELLYLTSGISWNTDYIADVTSKDKLDLSAWVTITNNSGTDFNNAKIKVIAADINAQKPMPAQFELARSKSMYASGMQSADTSVSNSAQSIGDYYFYDLENKATIKDKQSKQVSLFKKASVAYKKAYKFVSPLYIGQGLRTTDFNKINPEVVYTIKNDAASNLNILLPTGTVRFYENDKFGQKVFVGQNNISQTAKEETLELTAGKTSDFYASGKIINVSQISKDTIDVEMEVSFFNSKSTQEEIIFEQSFGGNWKISQENVASIKKNSSTLKWELKIPANGKFVLKYKVRIEN